MLGICGPVGSGKSSLVSAILGELRIQRGSIGIGGTLAYVPQQAWIFHDTVRQNILFGSKFDQRKYDRGLCIFQHIKYNDSILHSVGNIKNVLLISVIEVCSLKWDIEIWPNGDLTEVGERGITLSGGQKQRISLARSVNSDSLCTIRFHLKIWILQQNHTQWSNKGGGEFQSPGGTFLWTAIY